jgi:UDP-N-acetylmuramate dehydrogenase
VPIVNYAPLAEKVKTLAKYNQKPTAKQVVDSVCAIRSSKLPDPSHLPNAGSFFKNPVITKDHYERLRVTHSEVVAHPFNDSYKLAAGWLIDNIGLKGYCQQGVCVHKEQALVIVNICGSGSDVVDMANYVKQNVLSVYGIELEIEPRVI